MHPTYVASNKVTVNVCMTVVCEAETAAVSRGTSHVTTKQRCKYTTSVGIQKARAALPTTTPADACDALVTTGCHLTGILSSFQGWRKNTSYSFSISNCPESFTYPSGSTRIRRDSVSVVFLRGTSRTVRQPTVPVRVKDKGQR